MTIIDKRFGTNQVMSSHFSYVAKHYHWLRTTDFAPINFIRNNLKGCGIIRAADIGCGVGRYSYKLLQHLKIDHLICIDRNEKMLRVNREYLRTKRKHNYNLIKSSAEQIPLANNSLDCVFAFNAIHHFDVAAFLTEAARIVKPGARIFIYTRFRAQNAKNIWGMYFPSFLQKENRLYELDELELVIKQTDGIVLETVNEFRFKRKASLQELIRRARFKHYSTFSLYENAEFEQALKIFENNVSTRFIDLHNITWFDEYAMLVVRTKAQL